MFCFWQGGLKSIGIFEGEPRLDWGAMLADVPDAEGKESGSDGDVDMHGEGALVVAEGGDAELGLVDGVPLLQLLIRTEDVPDTRLTSRWLEASRHYLNHKVHIGSLAAEATSLGLDRKNMRMCRLMSAGLAVELERHFWASVEERVLGEESTGGVELVAYLEVFQYDGVDLTMATRQRSGLGLNFEVPEEGDEDSAELRRELDELFAGLGDDVEKGPTRIMNSVHAVAMLIRKNDKFMLLQCDPTTPLQAVDRYTGEAIREAMLQIRIGSEDTRAKAGRRIRLVITDAAGYNLRAERHHPRCDDTLLIHLLCDVHVAARIHGKVFQLMDRFVTGMQHVSRALSGGNTMSTFRRAVRRVMVKRLHLIHVAPDREAQEYKRAVLDQLCGGDFTLAPLRAALDKYASGDWRKKGTWEYLARPGETRTSVLKAMLKDLVPLLAGHCPLSFPRHRWTGANHSLRDLGLLQCIHGFMQGAFAEFMSLVDFSLGRGPRFGGGDGEGLDVGGDADADPELLPANSAEAKRAFRGKASEWINERDCDRDLMVLSVALDPIAGHMDRQIRCSSAEWATQQDASRMDLGSAGIRDLFSRSSWPLLQAASLETDQTFFADLAAAQAVEKFASWPPLWRTVETQALLFRLLSRQGAAVKELLVCKHRSFPYRLFNILRDPDAAEDVLRSCPPSRDAYTASFLEAHRDDLSSPSALAELAAVVVNASTCTLSLESSNASVRRIFFVSSQQVSMPVMESVSAEFVLGKLRRRSWERMHPAGHRQHWGKRDGRERGDHSAEEAPKQVRGGGAYRAFLSETDLAIDDPRLKDMYSALSDDERARLDQKGRLATAKHRLGLPSFPPRPTVCSLVSAPIS